MASKKRSHSDEGDPVVHKKHIISSPNGSPRVNGVDVPDHDEQDQSSDLELFRKEAIYRRMKHYARENDHNQLRIAELERRKNTCEAGLAAISACWTQLVEAIRLLAKPEELPPASHRTKEAFDLRAYLSESPSRDIEAILEENKTMTHSLVTRFVQLGGQHGASLFHNEAYIACQTAQSECAALRNDLTVARSRLQDAEEQVQKFHDELRATQNRCERLQSKSVLAQQPKSEPETRQRGSPETEDGGKHKQPSQALPEASPQINGKSPQYGNWSDWEKIAQSRQSEITAYQTEIVELRDQIRQLQMEVKTPTLATVGESPHYKNLLDKASRIQHSETEARQKADALAHEMELLIQKATDDYNEREYLSLISDLKNTLSRRDADIARLREARDQQSAELKERREKDQWKEKSLSELKFLTETQEERIALLESQLRRAKAQIAAKLGDEDMMQFLLGGSDANTDYVLHLRKQLNDAAGHASALEQTLNRLQAQNSQGADHIQKEVEALEKLAEVTTQLHKYQEVYGESSTLPPELSQLASQLQQKEDELKRLRLMNSQREETEASLYSEVDKLSAAWEGLEKQVKSKVFDLVATEDKLSKQGIERAKAENKYYAAMRDKDAIETERKALAKNVEKQTKTLDHLHELNRNLTTQVSLMDQEMVYMRRACDGHRTTISGLETDLMMEKRVSKEPAQRLVELQKLASDRDRELLKEKEKLQHLREDVLATRSALDRERESVKAAMRLNDSGKNKTDGKDSMVDELMALVKCSTCRNNMRSMVITKCGHSFCKNCVDSRIATRQRKCPSCNLPFAQSDAITLYLQ